MTLKGCSHDPDGLDIWDEDLPQNPWGKEIPEETVPRNDPDAMHECRRFAELAHYFVELAEPAAVNKIAGLGSGQNEKDKNETLSKLDKLMKHEHSYFVLTEEYPILYSYVYEKMKMYMKP